MAYLYQPLGVQSDYVDKKSGLTLLEWREKLRHSTTVYVGNLSFFTTEDQIYALFSTCGDIDMVVMGLNRKKKNPCGFCFVRFLTHAAAHRAVELLNGVRFDDRPIRVDWDSGEGIMEEYRKYGRGISGMQWRDEFRTSYDPGRGGEGGGIDYAAFSLHRGQKRRRFSAHGQARWEKYGQGGGPRHKRHAEGGGNAPSGPTHQQVLL